MALTDYKIKDADFTAKDIASLSDRPSADGMSATALKERFDAGAKKVVTPKLNALIDELVSQNGASGIGVIPIDGLSGYDIQNVLIAIKLLLDTKKPTETADIEIGKKFDASEAQSLVKSISFTEGTGVFTITKYDGTVETIDTAIEKVALDVKLDGQQFVLTLADGTEQRVDLSAFLTQTEVKSSDTITLALENGAITASVTSGSIKLAHLNSEVTSYFDAKTQQAVNSAEEAKVSEQNALNSANAAELAKQVAQECKQNACNCASNAALSESNALDSANEAKAAQEAAEKAKKEAETIAGGDFASSEEFNNHVSDKENPHGVTAEQIGAADSTHNHNASDINEGTLDNNRLPTVPVAKGGTGATDAATARSNLGITPANIGAAASSHTQAASTITTGTFPTTAIYAATGTDYTTARVRNISAGTSALTAGSSSLSNGNIYFVYE